MKQKVAYIQNIRPQNHIAHGVYVIKVCEAWYKNGFLSYLLVPKKPFKKGIENFDIWDYFNVEKNSIKIINLFNVPPFWLKLLFREKYFTAETLFLAFSSIIFCLRNNIKIIETSEYEVVWLYSLLSPLLKIKIIYDVHIKMPVNIPSFIKNNITTIIASSIKYSEIFNDLGLGSKTMALPNGYDPQIFKLENKKLQDKDVDRFVIGYHGRFETLGIEKGINNMLIIGSKLKAKIPLKLMMIGGPQEYLERYQELAKNLGYKADECQILSQVSHSQVGNYIDQFDLCWLIYPRSERFMYEMSPLKAIEYMASGKAIIASDFHSIRQVLNSNNAYLVDPDDKEEIIESIIKIYQNKGDAMNRAKHAYADVSQYTWENRQKKIISFAEV